MASNSADSSPSSSLPPLSIAEITARAQKSYYFDPLVSLKIYFRSADHLLQQASIYEREDNHQEAYGLLFKYTTLVLEDLPRHPQASLPEYAAATQKARRAAPSALAKMERLKPKIVERYERYQKLVRNSQQNAAKPARPSLSSRSSTATTARSQNRVSFADDPTQRRPSIGGVLRLDTSDESLAGSGPRMLPVEGNQELAAQLARQEIRRRRQARMSSAANSPLISPDEVQERRLGGTWGNWEKASDEGFATYSARHQRKASIGDTPNGSGTTPVDGDFQERMMETRRRIDSATRKNSARAFDPTEELISRAQSLSLRSGVNGTSQASGPVASKPPRPDLSLSTTSLTSSSRRSSVMTSPISATHIASQLIHGSNRAQRQYSYPSVPKRSEEHRTNNPESPATSSYVSFVAPYRFASSAPPERPPKDSLPSMQPRRPSKASLRQRSPSPEPIPRRPPISAVGRQTITFKPSAFLESGSPLRTIFLPSGLRSEFLTLAAPNTRRNLETCGILCGTLISNALFISKLVIPEQESTSDTCETVNENAIFDYCEKEDLMVLGWIHTHPTQTCFMSSRDLHTHAAYQAMLPESIAIVCAPSKSPSSGIFRLTDPPGKQVVLKCHQTGLFHPHLEDNIYTDALKPGHVVERPGFSFDTVDLRPGSKF